MLVDWLSKVLRPTRHILGHFGDGIDECRMFFNFLLPSEKTEKMNQF